MVKCVNFAKFFKVKECKSKLLSVGFLKKPTEDFVGWGKQCILSLLFKVFRRFQAHKGSC